MNRSFIYKIYILQVILQMLVFLTTYDDFSVNVITKL